MTALITTLIDKQDSFEIVRDKIAAILVEETASQMQLAVTANENPLDWKLRVFVERTNPWEQVLNTQSDLTPIVNVRCDKSTFDPSGSNSVQRQKCQGIFLVDCYGFGISENVQDGGHSPGDLKAAFEAQRCVRLVRNILMAGYYTYLGFPRGDNQVVWSRWINSIEFFESQIFSGGEQRHDIDVVKSCGARIAFAVTFNEISPQVEPVILEYIATTVKRLDTGEVIAGADFDFTS